MRSLQRNSAQRLVTSLLIGVGLTLIVAHVAWFAVGFGALLILGITTAAFAALSMAIDNAEH